MSSLTFRFAPTGPKISRQNWIEKYHLQTKKTSLKGQETILTTLLKKASPNS
jgi:hypothetical protein